MNISIACDHGGYALKTALIPYLESLGHAVKDYGCHSAERVDYPDFSFPASEAVANGACERGILICTSGVGMSICANKVRGVRCALCTDAETAALSRKHNDANVLALGAMHTDLDTAKQLIATWLATAFDGGRHEQRVHKISLYENTHEA